MYSEQNSVKYQMHQNPGVLLLLHLVGSMAKRKRTNQELFLKAAIS